jgi:hypothetical protein
MSQTTEKRSRLSRFGRWVAELVLVFVGVYAAFWLNSYQQHRQDAERRDQILASLEQQLREGIESGKINRAKQEQKAAEFRRALEAGEMPPLQPFVSSPITAQATGLRCFNPEASNCLTCRRSWRCATMNQLSAGD